MGEILHPIPDGDARTMKLAIASTVLFLLLNVDHSDAIFKKKWKKAQEDPWEPTRVADPWPADTDPWPADTGKDGCDVVYDDVWEEKCTTVYNDTKCHDEKDRSCEWVPHKVCKNKNKCNKVWEKKCEPHHKDVCKTHHDKECKEVWEKVCKDVKIRVVPDAVKYDYPEEHSSPLTYESAGGGGGGSDDYEDSHNSTRETRSVAKKLWKLQDKIDSKFDKAYSKLVHKAKKEKKSEPWPEEPVVKVDPVPWETERVCEDVPQTKCEVVPREVCHKEEHEVCKDVERDDCHTVPECKKHKQKKCWLEPKEKCVKLPKKECWDEPWEDCWDEKKEVCHDYNVRSCQPVPNKDCVKVTVKRLREVCIPEATKTKTKVEEW